MLLCRDDTDGDYIDCYTVASHGCEQTPRWIHHCDSRCDTCSSDELQLHCCDGGSGICSRETVMMQLVRDIMFTPVDSVPSCVCQPPQSCATFVASCAESHWHDTPVLSRPTRLSLADSIHSQRKCVGRQSHQKTVSVDHVVDRYSCQASETEPCAVTPRHSASEPCAVTPRHSASEPCAVTPRHFASSMKDESMIVTSDVSCWQQFSAVTDKVYVHDKHEVTAGDEPADSVNCDGIMETANKWSDDNADNERLSTSDGCDRLVNVDGSDGCERLVNVDRSDGCERLVNVDRSDGCERLANDMSATVSDICDNECHSVTSSEASSSSSSSSSSSTCDDDIDKTRSLPHSATAADIEKLYSLVRKKTVGCDCVRGSAHTENAVKLRSAVGSDEVQASCVDHFSTESNSAVHLTEPAADVKVPSSALKVPSSDVQVPSTSALSIVDESCCEDSDLLRSIVGHMAGVTSYHGHMTGMTSSYCSHMTGVTSSHCGHMTGVTSSQTSDAGLMLPRGDSDCRLLRRDSLLLAHSHPEPLTCVSDTKSLTSSQLQSFAGTLLAYDSQGSAFYVSAADMKVHGHPAAEPWFFPVPVTSLQVTILLSVKHIAGSFMLYRAFPHHSGVEYQLSVCNGVDVLHYHIVRNRHGDLSVAGHDHSFLSLSDLVCYLQHNKSRLATRLGRPVSVADHPVTAGVDYDARFELARSQLTLTGNIIGNGRFGFICAGRYRGHPVAVKVQSLQVLLSV